MKVYVCTIWGGSLIDLWIYGVGLMNISYMAFLKFPDHMSEYLIVLGRGGIAFHFSLNIFQDVTLACWLWEELSVGGISVPVLAVSGNEKCIVIINASWCLGELFCDCFEENRKWKGTEVHKSRRWAEHGKTAFLECIAASAYMKCYKFLRIILF